MAIIRPESTVYIVISGKEKGKRGVIWDTKENGQISLINIDVISPTEKDMFSVRSDELAQIETPGWKDDFPHKHLCTLEQKLQRDQIGDVVRDKYVVQPAALAIGDRLATGETVTKVPRRGCNSSVLICLKGIGWVELAPRLPLALGGNNNFKMPIELLKNDRLATRCLVVRDSESEKINWTNIYLNYEDCCLDVPSCVPLALA